MIIALVIGLLAVYFIGAHVSAALGGRTEADEDDYVWPMMVLVFAIIIPFRACDRAARWLVRKVFRNHARAFRAYRWRP